MFWRIVDHPRVSLITGLLIGGAGFITPRSAGYALWTIAAVLIIASAVPKLRGWRLRSPLYRLQPTSIGGVVAATLTVCSETAQRQFVATTALDLNKIW